MKKRWVAKPLPQREVLHSLEKEISTTAVLHKLMGQRGVSDMESYKAFFVPSLDALHPPFQMKGMSEAVNRLTKAISNQEHILVYGDYDVDGTTSVALVYSFLTNLPVKVSYYIPDRFAEGYGISKKSIEWAKEENISLIIALDCGIKAVDLVAFAGEIGIDYIICDHHNCGDDLPEAAAVLNPKQPGCDYPYKHLSGCGIGFKLVQGFAEQNSYDWDATEYLDLVAVSIASDIVPMTGENRILAHFGLDRINRAPRPGLRALMEVAGVDIPLKNTHNDVQINDLVFRVGPRINAAGRIGSGKQAVQMLVEKEYTRASAQAKALETVNQERKDLDTSITTDAVKEVEESDLNGRKKTTVLFNRDWHKGVIGIVASRLVDQFYRPTILLTETADGKAVGSGRSVDGYDLYAALSQCADLMEQWGGHQSAAGLTIDLDNLPAFRERFEKVVSDSITQEQLTPIQEYDLEICLADITRSFCKSLGRFGPFGPDNMRPVFVSRGVRTLGQPRLLKENHVQFCLSCGPEGKDRVWAIGFGMPEHWDLVNSGEAFDICYVLEGEYWKNQYRPKIYLKDISPCPTNILS